MDQRPLAEQLEDLRRQVASLEHALQRQTGRRRGVRGRSLWFNLTVAAACLIATATAYAQLKTFTAGTPAVASDINANFGQLKAWLEGKVGTATDANVTVAGNATVQGTATMNAAMTVNGATRLAGASTVALSNVMIDAPGDNYDVWIQGNATSVVGGDGRNLALLGLAQGNGDRLIINYGGEYASGTEIQGKVDIGLERVVCTGVNSGASCTCPSGKRLVGGGAYCRDDNEHLNTSYPASDTSWQAWCETSSGTNQIVDVTILCARIL